MKYQFLADYRGKATNERYFPKGVYNHTELKGCDTNYLINKGVLVKHATPKPKSTEPKPKRGRTKQADD